VLDALAEPLTHLLRNAVDHGVEPATERAAAGKPALGAVRVSAERVSGGVCVAVADDGRVADKLDEEWMGEAVADKGYHSNGTAVDLAEMEIRSYVAEPDRSHLGQRDWEGKPQAKAAVYANRRRVRGKRGKRLQRKRGELIERSFAHCYETGGMRRVHLRGRENVKKRLLIHVGGFNLSLVMRKLCGKGTPTGASRASFCAPSHQSARLGGRWSMPCAPHPPRRASGGAQTACRLPPDPHCPIRQKATFTTGC